jgi:hypothetical protein
MANWENLLGLTYDELASSESFSGIALPALEKIEDQSYLSLNNLGLSFVFPDNNAIKAIQFHSSGHEGFCGYNGALPLALSFSMSREQVREVLGEPDRRGEEGEVLFLGNKPAWDEYLKENHRIHIEYNFGGNALQLISIIAI